MSNRLFQGIVHQMDDVIDRTFGVIDETGTVISCSELGRIGEIQTHAVSEVFATSHSISSPTFTKPLKLVTLLSLV